MLEIINGKIQRDDFILENINLDIKPNSFNIIVGRNGAGKSSLLYTLTGSVLLTEGNIKKENIRIGFVSNQNYIRETMGVWEIPNLISNLDENFDKKIFVESVKNFKIDRRVQFTKLSLGQQKLVMLAIAIARDVDLLILDEINLNIDSHNEAQIVSFLEEFINKENKAIVLSTNKLDVFEDMADQIIYIKDNAIFYQGNVETLLNTYKIYNGDKKDIINDEEIVAQKINRYGGSYLLKNSSQGTDASLFEILSLLERVKL